MKRTREGGPVRRTGKGIRRANGKRITRRLNIIRSTEKERLPRSQVQGVLDMEPSRSQSSNGDQAIQKKKSISNDDEIEKKGRLAHGRGTDELGG